MDYVVYQYSLCIALSLMLFFACYFFFGRTPEKEIFATYLRSRRIMGAALLALSANYSVHLFYGIRFVNVDAAILMNLSTYFLCYWLFSSALITLLNRFYLTPKRIWFHLSAWVLFTGLSVWVLFGLPKGTPRHVGLLFMTIWLFSYGIWLARRIIVTYRRSVRSFDDTHSDYIAVYIKWMSFYTYWAVIYGVSCGLLTFLPDEYVSWWIISSIPFYIYLFCSYLNYLLFYEQVERALEVKKDSDTDDDEEEETEASDNPQFYEGISGKLNDWIAGNSFTEPGFTIEDLARALNTNRTYLSHYIKNIYKMSFREWVTSLRLDYAKKMLLEHPEMNVSQVAEESGFLSLSYFSKIFTEKEGCSPARWRKSERG